MADLDERTKTVLGLVNIARRTLRMLPLSDIPKGIRGDTIECPIAVALGMQVTGSYAVRYWSEIDPGTMDLVRSAWNMGDSPCQCGWCELLPPAISEWIQAFDKGLFPQYEEDPAELDRQTRDEAASRAREEGFEIYVQQIEGKLGFSEHGRAQRFA